MTANGPDIQKSCEDVLSIPTEKAGSTLSQLTLKIKDSEMHQLSKKAVVMQISMAILANVTIASSGMGLGFPSIALPELTNKMNGIYLSESQSSWFASITSIMCPFGGLIAGYTLDTFGRKVTLILINIISIISWTLIYCSSGTNLEILYIQLMIARVLIGIGIGLSSSPASVYAAEICHPTIRGRLTILSSLFTAIGMLFVYTLGYFISTDWRLVGLISGGFTLFSLLLLIPMPESPSWLVSKQKLSEAEKSLKIVRGLNKKGEYSQIDDEMDTLVANTSKFKGRNMCKENKWTTLQKPEVYKPLILMIVFFTFQQFSGIFVIIVYAARFSTEAGVNIDPFLCAVFIGLTRVCTTPLLGYIMDKFGRKPPCIFSGIGMTICMIGLAVLTQYPVNGTKYEFLPVFIIIVYIFSCTLGFLTLPFAMIAEIYPQRIRGFAAGLTVFAGYTMSFIIIKLYPTLVATLGTTTVFTFFGIVSFFGVFFVYYFLPETKGKSLQEIEAYFINRGKKKIEMQI